MPGLAARFHLGDETFTQARHAASNADGLRIDLQTAKVWLNDRPVFLTAKEFLALRAMVVQAGSILSKDALAHQVWPEYEGAVGDVNIEQLISRLRRKIEANPAQPRRLLTVRGLGYRLIIE